jgi:murein L,D-transpeptidase YafK
MVIAVRLGPRIGSIYRGTMSKKLLCVGLAAAVGCLVGACGNSTDILPAMRPLPKETVALLGKKGMTPEAPIFVRIFKEESELEVWKLRDDGHFYHFKTYPICNWSGDLGPKERQGDKQAPEGFYTIAREQMNPNSSYHLAFNIGFPNAYDRSLKRTGEFLMVHGKCKPAGCYAKTDALTEESYALAREQFIAGHESFEVHAFPFRMTPANMARHARDKWTPFWATLKQGYDYFETTRQLPNVAVCERRYLVNVKFAGSPARLDPEGRCPAFVHPQAEPFTPSGREQIAESRIVVPGDKMRQSQTALAGVTSTQSTLPGPFPAFSQSKSPSALGFAPTAGE